MKPNWSNKSRIGTVAVAFATSAALITCAAQPAPEPGPESGGLQLRLVVITDRQAGADSREVTMELLNVTKEPITLLADWPYEQDKGSFTEYLEQAVNLAASPEIGGWEGQIRAPDRTSPQPEYVLRPDTPILLKWTTTGRNLKNKENRVLDSITQALPTDGLYTVNATVTIRTKDGKVSLKSNGQKVPVGGRTDDPKHPLGRIIGTDASKVKATIDIGAKQKIENGDQFIVRTGMGDFWRLTIERVGPKEAEGPLVPADAWGRDAPQAKPPLPRPGTLARLRTDREPQNQPSEGTR